MILCKRLREEEPFVPPERKHAGDAGFDLVVCRHMQIAPGQIAHLATNLAMALPNRMFGMIVPRSSTLWRKGLHISIGIIDNGYRGEVMIVAKNLSDQHVAVQEGERVAQLLILPMPPSGEGIFKQVSKLSNGDRGDAGFGSTGE